MSLPEALDAAKRNVPTVLASIAQSRIADAQIRLARAALEPFVTGSATATVFGTNGNVVNGFGSATCVAPAATVSPTGGTGTQTVVCGGAGTAFLNATVSARWALWDFGRTALNVEAARLSARSFTANVESAERLAVAGAGIAYFALLADEEAISASDETLRQRVRELDISVARVRAGADPEINQVRAEVARQTAQLDLSRARAAALNDAAAFASALGLESLPTHRAWCGRHRSKCRRIRRARQTSQSHRVPKWLPLDYRCSPVKRTLAAVRALWRPTLTANASIAAQLLDSTGQGGTSLTETGITSLVLSAPIYDPTIPANLRIAEEQVLSAQGQLLKNSCSRCARMPSKQRSP